MEQLTILNILTEELSNSIGGDGDIVSESRKTALRYYLGKEPAKPEADTDSQVTSTDVADAIEWIKPEVIKAFTQNNEVISFDALADGDEDQADMETEYTYGVLMKENDGFIAIHTLIQDCLLQKNGIIKVYYNDEQDIKAESYTGLSKQQLEMLVSDPEVSIMNMSGEAVVKTPPNPDDPTQQHQVMPLEEAEALVKKAKEQAMLQVQPLQQKLKQLQQIQQQMQGAAKQNPQLAQQVQENPAIAQMAQKAQQQLQQIQQQIQQTMSQVPQIVEVSIDVKIKKTKDRGKVTVIPVPPEEFRISSRHNSVNPRDAAFTAHVLTRTRGELLQDYPDSKEAIQMAASSSAQHDEDESYRFYEQDEMDNELQTTDKSQDEINVFECYLTIDIEDDGIGKLMQIVAIGSDEVPNTIVEQVEIEENPFMSGTAILMSHKWLGLSFYDRLKEIQDEKTYLWRSINNNLALINNKEYEVVEGKVNLDDLLVSRPGGIKRVKAPGMLREIQTSPLPPDTYKMFEYLDMVRTGRSGVSPEAPGQNHMIGAETAHGIERLMTKKEELVGLVVRVIAETAIKPMVIRIRDLLIRNSSTSKNFKFRGQWKQFNPARWQERSLVTVRVGTGSGNNDRQIAALSKLGDAQTLIKQDPNQALVDENKIFKLLDDLSKAAGLTGAREYIIDPKSNEGKAHKQKVQQVQDAAKKQQQEVDQAFAKSQIELAKAEQMKATADLQAVQVKAESEKVKAQNESLKAQLAQQKQQSDAQLTYQDQMNSVSEAQGKQHLDAIKLEMGAMKGKGEMQIKYDELEFKYFELQQKLGLEEQKIDSAESMVGRNQSTGAPLPGA